MAVKKQKTIQLVQKSKPKKSLARKNLNKKNDLVTSNKSKSFTPTESNTINNFAKKPAMRKTLAKGSSSTTKRKILKEDKPVKNLRSEVVLPLNMSKRAIEKTIVFTREFDYYFRHSAYQIAYVTGLCFLLVGTSLLASQTINPGVAKLMFSEVISSESTTQTIAQTIPNPVFTLFENIPSQIDSPYRVLFSVTNALEVVTKLVVVGKTGFINLNTDLLSDNKYRTDIPVNSLSPGYYKVKFYVRPLNGGSATVFESNEFHIGQPEIIKTTSTAITEEPIYDTNKESELVETNKTNEETKIETLSPSSSPAISTQEEFLLFKPDNEIMSGTKIIIVSAPESYSFIELYARPLHSLTPRFVSLASKRFEHWNFVVNSTNLPNGKYEFFARSKNSGKVAETKPIIITISNDPPAIISRPTSNIQNPFANSESTVNLSQDRPLVALEKEEVFVPSNIVNNDAERETRILLTENSSDIDSLLKRYAVAKQSGNEMLIDSARKSLQEKREEIVFKTLQNSRLQDISDNINQNLLLRIDDLQNRIDTFEQIRIERSGGKTSIDTDKDGISDYDEINLYGTNPDISDTDNDGVTDGVEIMRGFDPLNVAPEAVIQFESPRESIGLVREDSLKVENVSAVITATSDSEISPIRSEIKGLALPNSFVTLYIFSTPTVVTIRTDADGSFVYTFDKELDDGKHDVYVAVTDNAGKIIAQSNPFSFIKRAEAYTPVDAAEAEIGTSESVVGSSRGVYNTVVGIGILALGTILLMLGISLRTKNEITELSINETNDQNIDINKVNNTKKTTSVIEHIDAS